MRRLPSALFLLGPGLLAGGLGWHGTAAATTIYECTTADGRLIYQDTPCRAGQKQRTMEVADAPSAPPAAAAPSAPEPPAPASPPPAPEPPSAPLPLMYTCVRATDGKSYLSDNGNPAPYQAPLGVLGAWQQPLSDVYGPDRGGAGISAPEANRGRVSSGLVANNYVWVQDQCRELDIDETCQALQEARDENEHKLRNAFKSQRPPLEKREAQLRAQLANCGG
ncbi:DUF4124 domain-containing protein [Frateuria sp. STR12]|uniref:DUF4124 domain-containing protein n=1 Tax=Frateuria hangzhouensis TaxID=2995589 RepID=UPI002260BF2F|nr:DUF4124 domain-containing protein [Frateuria sp. STR12]MCX7512742.1 DUF4124 domain-containing protein [Frateuria sp. STR12]